MHGGAVGCVSWEGNEAISREAIRGDEDNGVHADP